MNTFYKDKDYSSCIKCKGTGYIKNFLNEIVNKNLDIKKNIVNNLETYKNLAPYIKCISCHGTGKKDYHIVLHYTCCLNKDKN